MIRRRNHLRCSVKQMEERRERLKRMLNLEAPNIIVIGMAENYLRCFKPSIAETWGMLQILHFPHWALWLTSAAYRKTCREPIEIPDYYGEVIAPINCQPQESPEQ